MLTAINLGHFRGRLLTWLLIVLFNLPAATGLAQVPTTLPNPRLSWVFPAGGQVGTTFEVLVSGLDLVDVRELTFNHPGITAKLKMVDPGLGQTERQPVDGTFLVSIAPNVEPGVYELRVPGKFGLSNPRMFCVGVLNEVRETEPNNLPAQANKIELETTINGTCDLAAADFYKFSAKLGQRVIIDCQAFRIDSRLDGTLVLFDSTGRELERSYNINRRDPLIDFTVPQDGEYLVSLQDQSNSYRMYQAEAFYRLSISTMPFLDFVFPPVGQAGTNSVYTIYGRNLPGGKLAPGVEVGAKTLEKIEVNIPLPAEKTQIEPGAGGLLVEPSESFIDGIAYRLMAPRGPSNPILLSITDAPIQVEQEPNDLPARAQLLKPPCEFVGQFYPSGDRDWVTIQAKKDDVYYIDLACQRLGHPTDPRMVIQQVKVDESGREQIVNLKSIDDDLANVERVHWSFLDSILFSLNHYDPVYRFVAPEDGTYRILIQDLSRSTQDLARNAQGNSRFTYRLSVHAPSPDFRLVAMPRPPTNQPTEMSNQAINWSTVLRQSGSDLIEVYAVRRDGFEGEIVVTAENLPPGVTCQPVVIAPKEVSATLVLKAADDAPPGTGSLSIKGTSKVGDKEIIRPARVATMNWNLQELGVTFHRSRLTDQLRVSVISNEQAPYSVFVEPNLKLDASVNGSVNLAVRIVRRGEFKGPVELFVYGLPPTAGGPLHAQPKYHTPISIPANQETIELPLKVPFTTLSGTYSFFISGVGTVSYSANPEKLRDAEVRLAAIEKIVVENESRLKAVMEAQTIATKALADAQTANQNVQAAAEAKTAADKVVAEADAKLKLDAAFLTTFRTEVTQLKEKCKPNDLKISTSSNVASMRILPVPFEPTFGSLSATMKQGTKIEIPLTVKRLYSFVDPINAQFHGVFSISGINSPFITIPAGQSEGKVIIEAAAGTAVGRYKSIIRTSATYNGLPLYADQEFVVTIEPSESNSK